MGGGQEGGGLRVGFSLAGSVLALTAGPLLFNTSTASAGEAQFESKEVCDSGCQTGAKYGMGYSPETFTSIRFTGDAREFNRLAVGLAPR